MLLLLRYNSVLGTSVMSVEVYGISRDATYPSDLPRSYARTTSGRIDFCEMVAVIIAVYERDDRILTQVGLMASASLGPPPE